MQFDWDDANWPKCAKHGVTQTEIEHALANRPLVLPDRNPPDTETRLNAVGLNQTGRHLFIVFTLRVRNGNEAIRPISARYMHTKEIESYERQTS